MNSPNSPFVSSSITFLGSVLNGLTITTTIHTDLAVVGRVVKAIGGDYKVVAVHGPRYCQGCGLGLAQLQTSKTCPGCQGR